MVGRKKQLEAQLSLLRHSFENMDGIAVLRLSGLIEAALLPTGIEPDRLAAMAGPLLALAAHLCDHRQVGAPVQCVLRLPDRSFLVLLPMRPSAAMLVLCRDRLSYAGGDPWLNLACIIRDLERLL